MAAEVDFHLGCEVAHPPFAGRRRGERRFRVAHLRRYRLHSSGVRQDVAQDYTRWIAALRTVSERRDVLYLHAARLSAILCRLF